VPDFAMGTYLRLVTRWTPVEIEALEAQVASGALHPRDAKMKLAREIVEIFYGPAEAQQAEQAFIRVFQEGDVPAEMPSYTLQEGDTVLDVMRAGKLVSSNSEGRRMVQQNAVSLDGEKLADALAPFPGPGVLRVGRRKFLRVVS